MTSSVIVSTARTPLAQERRALQHERTARRWVACRQAAVERAGIDGGRSRRRGQGLRHPRRARPAATSRARSRCVRPPVSVGGMTINRFCSSGLQTMPPPRSASLPAKATSTWRVAWRASRACRTKPTRTCWSTAGYASTSPRSTDMLQTAENVAKRLRIWPRPSWDAYGAAASRKLVRRRRRGKFQRRDISVTPIAGVADAGAGLAQQGITITADDGLRAGTPAEGIAGISRPCRVA